MHDGFKLVRLPEWIVDSLGSESASVGQIAAVEDEQGPKEVIVKRFDGHESLAYGADWSRLPADEDTGGECMVVSCSFYDHCMHLWTACLGSSDVSGYLSKSPLLMLTLQARTAKS